MKFLKKLRNLEVQNQKWILIDFMSRNRNQNPHHRRRSHKKQELSPSHPPLIDIEPLTDNQRKLFDAYDEDKNIVAYGYPGTGKSVSLLYKALKEIFDKQSPCKKVVIVRSAVATRDVGYLKGSLEQKVGEFETPYKHMLKSLFDCSCEEEYEMLYGNLKAQKSLEFMTTSFIRGLTLNDSIIIVDEFENLTFHELDSIITRVGENSKIHFSGDLEQSDLTRNADKKGISSFMNILLNMSSFERIDFEIDDIVRSPLVKEFIIAKDKLNLFSSAF